MYDGRVVRLRQIGRDEWDNHWQCIGQTNLLQSWEYGDAKAVAENWQPLRFLFETDFGKPLALAQVLTRTWPVVGGVARLNRGPILLEAVADLPEADQLVFAALRALRHEARRRRWWLLYAAPEIGEGEANRRRLAEMGFWPRLRSMPWASARLSLVADDATLLANLDGKWRNILRKSQKSNIRFAEWDGDSTQLDELIKCYGEMQRLKGFSGIPEKLLVELSKQNSRNWRFNFYMAVQTDTLTGQDTIVGMLVSIAHGNTATYIIGCTDSIGRKSNANYMLLWAAILRAKEIGCQWYDLGGLNENTPGGVRHFKSGLGGVPYKLIGEVW